MGKKNNKETIFVELPIYTDEYSNFQSYMNSYIAKIESIAKTLRANELLYINNIIKNNKAILPDRLLSKIESLMSADGINISDYDEIIEALNRIQHKGDQSLAVFKKAIDEQITNIGILNENMKAL